MAYENNCCITTSDVLSYDREEVIGKRKMQSRQLEDSIEKLQKGDTSQLDVIYRETSKQVFAAAIALVKDYALAEDVMQETYIRFLQGINSYRMGSSPVSYLLTVCKNVSLNILKHRSYEVNVDCSESDKLFGSYDIQDDDKGENIKLLLKGLSDEEREVLLYKVYADLKHREIAKLINKPLGTVLWLYNKAMKKVKRNMANKKAEEL